MRSRRQLLRVLLVVIAVLFIAIYVGVSIGDRIRTASQSQSADEAELPTPVPDDGATYAPAQNGWKRMQVVAIATDPGFPDPRVTPSPTPSPTVAPPTPRPSPQRTPHPAPSHAPDSRPIWDLGTPGPEEEVTAPPHNDDFGN
jgi:hypothetical protein